MLDGATLIAVIVTILAFAAGVFVGWLWWGRRYFATRLTREEALDLVQERIGVDLQAKDQEIARLRGLVADPADAYVRGEEPDVHRPVQIVFDPEAQQDSDGVSLAKRPGNA